MSNQQSGSTCSLYHLGHSQFLMQLQLTKYHRAPLQTAKLTKQTTCTLNTAVAAKFTLRFLQASKLELHLVLLLATSVRDDTPTPGKQPKKKSNKHSILTCSRSIYACNSMLTYPLTAANQTRPLSTPQCHRCQPTLPNPTHTMAAQSHPININLSNPLDSHLLTAIP